MKIKLSILLLALSLWGQAQTFSRTVVGTAGDFFTNSDVSVAWTIGEVVTDTYSSSGHFLTQGFQQPDNAPRVPENISEFFNAFSPNGDGKNDTWKIPALSFYTTNSVIIVNRWGSEVWRTDNYDNVNNVWNGKNLEGNDLPDGTYYYIINYNNTQKRGWVFIKR
jgi:gliding motility-associated-like protein